MSEWHIPLADPRFDGKEREYVDDCLRSGWISGSGKYLDRFEAEWAKFCGAKEAIAVSNGTAALHLALLAVGVGPGDRVIVPDLTYVATANAVTYCGATPAFCDVDPVTWCLDPNTIYEEVSRGRARAILPVHLYGHPAPMARLRYEAETRQTALVDDAAQAHGAEYRGNRVGALCNATAWSFHAGKIITTGEGGMVTTNDPEIAARIRLLRAHGMDPERRYWFPVIGYNYRMTNLQAAVGCAQLERIEEILSRRAQIARWYQDRLSGQDLTLPHIPTGGLNVFWLFSVLLPYGADRDEVISVLSEQGIETRPFFHPLHLLPPYVDHYHPDECPVSVDLAQMGISLPSSDSLSESDVDRVCQSLWAAIHSERAVARV